MKRIVYVIVFLAIGLSQSFAEMPKACIGSRPVNKFRLLLEPANGAQPLPVSSVNIIKPGERLKYEPLPMSPAISDKARITLVLVPGAEDPSKKLVVLDAKPANAAVQWTVPLRASVLGMVYGPRGLDVKKVSSLVEQNRDLITELADYAQETATAEALVRTLSQYEQSPPGSGDLNAALQGFSTQYGVAVPKLDTAAPTSQQASALLRAIMPSLSTYDPLASTRTTLVQQSTGLAASVASLFFGNPVILAAGGASLFENMRSMLFPNTDFLSSFALPIEPKGMELCTKAMPVKSRARPAYLWMLRVPDTAAPSASMTKTAHLPLGWKSSVEVTTASIHQLRLLPRARDWELVSGATKASVPVTVKVGPHDDVLSLDLTKVKLHPGIYHLAAKWDWDPFQVKGAVQLHPFGDLSGVRETPRSSDHLIAGTGTVNVQLTGGDFEFVNKVAIEDHAKAARKVVPFTLSSRHSNGEQRSLTAKVNTSALTPGAYLLALTQSNGQTHNVPVKVHPPNPKIANLPLRANLGETQQSLNLQGTGLERIERLTTSGATLSLGPVPPGSQSLKERKVTIKLPPGAHVGERLSLSMSVAGIKAPIQVPDAIEVIGPRPKILALRRSDAEPGSVEVRDGEIPAGSAISFAVRTQDAGPQPAVELGCSNPTDTRQTLTLHPGERNGQATLEFAGEDVLFLSFVPGTVGESGCLLNLKVASDATGVSDPTALGRVVRLPRIEKFSLTDKKLGSSLYAGVLTGEDLQMISKTGWNAKKGFPVKGIPVPVSGDPRQQSLQIELPWPSPSPHSSLYIWLRGEKDGRMTTAKN